MSHSNQKSQFPIKKGLTIIATAVPQITNAFHYINDIGWYASAYMITACSSQLLYGRIYTFYSPKWVLSHQRLHLRNRITDLRRRTKLSYLYRRSCGCWSWFSRNLLQYYRADCSHYPAAKTSYISKFNGCYVLDFFGGGAALLLTLWLLPANNNKTEHEIQAAKLSPRETRSARPHWNAIISPGDCMTLARVAAGWNKICLERLEAHRTLGLLWASDDRFCWSTGVETRECYFSSSHPSIPQRDYHDMVCVLHQRITDSNGLFPARSGLMTTFKVDTREAIWIGYQVIFGFGIGFGQQQADLAAQTALPTVDVPVCVSLKFFGQQLGGAIFVSVGQNVLTTKFASGLAGIPNLDPPRVA
ncbi:hypothetical protein G7Y89_g13739 [Cudoniella acicularis]|uniref:Uncharacterized protein n=1 Tax=Cudoniella acicularis TaxID=354080 RepID=A0A8H4VVS4_9HELO|nr:hypothetical protein G7Y89_g13739 [Cudoniella acicularis]